MTQEAINQGKVLFHLSVERETVEAFEKIYQSAEPLKKVMESPIVLLKAKWNIINKIFETSLFDQYQDSSLEQFKNFIKIVCKFGKMNELEEIIRAYYDIWDEKQHILRANIYMAQMNEEKEQAKIKDFLNQRYPEWNVVLNIHEKPDLLGGTLIQVGHEEYDFSFEGRLRQLERKLTGR